MKAKIVCYRFRKISPSQRTTFHKEMYGYKDYSNRGKYVYQRKGVLATIRHRKILDAVIVTDTAGADAIARILRKYRAKVYIFDVIVPFRL